MTMQVVRSGPRAVMPVIEPERALTVVERIQKALSPKTGPKNAPTAVYSTGGAMGMVYGSAVLTRPPGLSSFRQYAQTPWIFAALNIRKDQVASSEWDIVPFDNTKRFAARQRDRLLELFDQPTAALDSFQSFCKVVLNELLIADGAPIEKVRTPNGDIGELWPVISDAIQIDARWDGSDPEAARYYYVPDGTVRARFKNEDMVYLMSNPRAGSPYGISPIGVLATVIESELQGLEYNRRQVMGAAPDGVLNIGENAGPDDVQKAESKFRGEVFGQGAMAVIGGWKGSSWMPFRSTNREMQFREWTDYLIRCIATVLGLSPMDLAITFDVNRSCYSEDTETLTENGWKFYWEINQGEKIATFNPENEKIEFHVPSAAYIYPYEGKMVHFTTRGGVDVMVTPEHDMWVKDQPRDRITKPWKKIKAGELAARDTTAPFTFRGGAGWDGDEVETFEIPAIERFSRGAQLQIARNVAMDDWLEFLGYVISEGCIFQPAAGSTYEGRYKVMLSQSELRNPEKVAKIEACLSRLPIKWASYVDQTDRVRRWQVSDKALWTWLRANVGGKSATKFIPAFVKNLSMRQQQIALDALMLGDGSIGPNWHMYYTSSDQLADDVQEMALKLGYRASRRYSRGGKVNVVSLIPPSRANDHVLQAKTNIELVDYEGVVYCFNVPNHLFVTRRNGKIGIHGNTAEAQGSNSDDRGLRPLMALFQSFMTREIVWDESFGGRANNLQFVFKSLNLDETEQKANINKIAMPGIGWKSINEARSVDGRAPIGDPTDDTNIFNHVLIGTPVGIMDLNTQMVVGAEKLAQVSADAQISVADAQGEIDAANADKAAQNAKEVAAAAPAPVVAAKPAGGKPK
jgi:hypothetical protein